LRLTNREAAMPGNDRLFRQFHPRYNFKTPGTATFYPARFSLFSSWSVAPIQQRFIKLDF
ncbi:MAG: hypothetical protein AAFQ41_15605, partial [Cyanobacteria bacterium J06623_7]